MAHRPSLHARPAPLRQDDLGARPRPFPILDRAFDAVERALATLGVEDPASLRSPRPVEEVLSDTALPEGTLLVLSPDELRAAEVDVEETVKDERAGGAAFSFLAPDDDSEGRKRALRELASATPTFCFVPGDRVPKGLHRVHAVERPAFLRHHHVLMADTPGFRVAVVRRDLPGGGWIALWTGNEDILAEIGEVLRPLAREAGHDVPDAAPAVPPLEGVEREADVWAHAADLRAYRVIREAELREIARQAALKGVRMRRERERKKREAEKRAAG